MMRVHYTRKANEFVNAVLTGKIEVDTDLKEACERHKHQLKKDSGKTFDHQEVERIGWFLKNIGGVDVTPYHCFMAATVFGWKEREVNNG